MIGGVDYRDLSYQYVGYGNNTVCVGQSQCPGYININSTAPGAYFSCYNGLVRDQDTAYYLLDHVNLQWVDANSSSILSVPNLIILNGTDGILWPMAFGRVFYNGQWTLGKALIGNGHYKVQIYGNTGEITYLDNFQVLTCTPQTSGQITTQRVPIRSTSTVVTTSTVATTTTKPSLPCGTFVYYDPIKGRLDPDTYGVIGGVDYNDLAYQYVGYGKNELIYC